MRIRYLTKIFLPLPYTNVPVNLTPELRRLHLDLIFCYNIRFGIDFSDIFEFSHVSETRGHAYKLCKSRSNNNTRYRFFLLKELSACGIPGQQV